MHSLPHRKQSLGSGTLRRLAQALHARSTLFDAARLPEPQQIQRIEKPSNSLHQNDNASAGGRRRLRIARLPSVRLSLSCIDAGNGYELTFQRLDEFVVSIPLCGQGWVDHGKQSFQVFTGQILLLGPFGQVRKRWNGPGHVLALHIPMGLLEAALTRPDGKGLSPDVTLVDHLRLETLLGLVELLLLSHDSDGRCSIGETGAEYAEQLLIDLLVDALDHSQEAAPTVLVPTSSGPLPPKPYYVRRAEEYIRARIGSPISIDGIVAAAGVSRRTLQYGFRSTHGTTPMLYVRKLRLESARAALRDAAYSQRRISDIAADVGYFNMCQFCRDYRAMFGESASKTAARRP